MRKKLLSSILIIAMLFNMCISFNVVYATDSKAIFDITGPAEAYQGATVNVKVSATIVADTSIQGVETNFEYSDNFSELNVIGNPITVNTIGWGNVGITKTNLLGVGFANAAGGVLEGVLSFNIPEDAPFGTQYTISFGDVYAVSGSGEELYRIVNDSYTVTVVDLPEIPDVEVDNTTVTFDGDEHTIDVSIPEGANIQYSEDDDTYSAELPSYRNVGEYDIYYVVSKDGFRNTEGKATVTINEKELSDSMIETITAQRYTGSKITPTITVKDGEPSIITSADYEVVGYGENINVATGGSVTIEGRGNYKGTATKYFEISRATMEVSENDYEGIYDGTAHTGSVVVSKPSNAVIKYGTTDGEYDLETIPTYTNAGTYTIYYKATDANFNDATGSITVKINAKEVTAEMIGSIAPITYTGSQITPSITVEDGEPSIITSADYEVVGYGENINVATGGSVTIEGRGNYKGTATKTFEILPIEFPNGSIVVDEFSGIYDGIEHSSIVTIPEGAMIKYGDAPANCNSDQLPKYVNSGDYTIYYVVSKDNYIDYKSSMTVSIKQKALSNSMIETITAQRYTGSQLTPSITVKDGEPSIITPADYEVSYGENINVATGGSVTITGKGNYKGTATKTFEISRATMEVQKNDYEGTYDGVAHTGSVVVTKPSNAAIMYGTTDGVYELETIPTYTNVGTYTIYYKATDANFNDATGSITVKINAKEVTAEMIGSIAPITYTGSQLAPSITVKDGEPSIITPADYEVSYGENINVATGGSVTITGKGNYKGTATKTFEISRATMEVQKNDYEGTYDGVAHTGSVVVTKPSNAEVRYGTTDGEYDLEAIPTYTNVGAYTIYYKATDANFNDATGSITVKINAKEVTAGMIESIAPITYTGSQLAPSITVKDGEPSIITPADYEVSYGENINVATGGSVTITGKGNYKGTATKTFEISRATMEVQKNDYEGTYDGVAHTGSVVVTKPSNAAIMYGTTDGVYELETIPTYTNVGTYTIYYKATDANFNDATGSITVKINAKEVTAGMIESIAPITYTGSQLAPSITVKDGEPSIITPADYEVSYGENINVATGGSVTITGKGNYKGTATKTFEISRAVMDVQDTDYEGTYDGTAHTGSVTVINPSNAEVRYGTTDSEYDLEAIPTYTNVGTYTIYYQVTDSNYETVNGSILVEIQAKELESSMVDNITAQEYTGSQIKPTITVRDGEPSIITPTDYDVSYGENINVATGGSVTITGKGNYKGTITKNFEISLAVLNVSKTDYTGVYDGSNHKASITVDEECETTIKYGLVEGEYTLTEMPEYKNAGTYKVYYKVDADNYSSATGYVTVSISTKDLSENMIFGVDESYVYTGVAINPNVTITDGEPNIITSDDYDVSYGENINVATGGSVTIAGKGNYSGEIVCDFAIQKAPLTISTINKTVIYGDAIELPINYSGFVNSETETVLLTQPIVSGYGNNPSVGEYDLIISGATADNYEITYDNTSKLSVDKRSVSISSLTVFDKLHDGTDVATINVTSAIFTDVINDDVLLLDISQATATFSSSEVGNNISVNIAGLAIKGDSSNNYVLNNDTYQTAANITSSISASQIAQQITSLVIDRNASVVEFPELPSGYTVSIKTSSDESVIDLQGNIYDFDESKTVEIVLTISNDDGTDVADTAAITVTIPASVKLTVTVVASENGTATGSGDFFKYENVTVSAVPNSGYEFEGWYIGTEKVSGDISYTFTLTEATTLVAKFKETQRRGGGSGIRTSYTVKVHFDDEIISYKAYRNDTVKSIKTPQKDGFVFEGWYSDLELTKPVAMDTKITSSISLYPKMTPVNVPDDWNNPFVDINESDWYFEAVKFVVEQGLFKGISENQFGPDMHVTRGMLVTVMYRAEGEPEVEMNNGFIDVEDNAYYSNAISWAKSNNIVNGYDSETFGPNDSVTREQIATIIARYSKLQGLSSEDQIDTTFADSNAISDWAVDSVRYCKQIGLILGDNNNQFNPQNSTTRAETATILYRYMQMIK